MWLFYCTDDLIIILFAIKFLIDSNFSESKAAICTLNILETWFFSSGISCEKLKVVFLAFSYFPHDFRIVAILIIEEAHTTGHIIV